MTTMQDNPAQTNWDELGPSEARGLLFRAQERFYEANAELEFAMLMCGQTNVSMREIGPIIHRDPSTAWERINTLRRKWAYGKLAWPARMLLRLNAFPTPSVDGPPKDKD